VIACAGLLASTLLVAPRASAFGTSGHGGFSGGIAGGRPLDTGAESGATGSGAGGPVKAAPQEAFDGRWPGGARPSDPATSEGGDQAKTGEASAGATAGESATAGEGGEGESPQPADVGHRGITIGPGMAPATQQTAEPSAETTPASAKASQTDTLPHERDDDTTAPGNDRHYYGYHAGGDAPAIDTVVATLPGGAQVLSVDGQPYYYGAGVFYRPSEGGFTVARAPIGGVVDAIPRSAETVAGNDGTFYYFNGVYLRWVAATADRAGGYEVVEAPYGAMVSRLPVGAREEMVDASQYYVDGETYYKPFFKGAGVVYLVVINPH